ncbi:hypothetical protein [Merismopedia glauca]|nr:hypothetical protein [Merismopedia glauca]
MAIAAAVQRDILPDNDLMETLYLPESADNFRCDRFHFIAQNWRRSRARN